MKLVWYAKAEADLHLHIDYLADRNPYAAISMAKRVRSSVEHLLMFPEAGRPTALPRVREVVIVEFPYIVRYRVKGNNIQILRVFHSSQSLERD